jgi:hypothetical protein
MTVRIDHNYINRGITEVTINDRGTPGRAMCRPGSNADRAGEQIQVQNGSKFKLLSTTAKVKRNYVTPVNRPAIKRLKPDKKLFQRRQ